MYTRAFRVVFLGSCVVGSSPVMNQDGQQHVCNTKGNPEG